MDFINSCYPFSLPPLPYPGNGLNPVISEETVFIHYNKHFGGYIDKLNDALRTLPRLQPLSLSHLCRISPTLPQPQRDLIGRNAGGVFNHFIYFHSLCPGGSALPNGHLARCAERQFGSFEALRERIKELASDVFGSGYVFLCADRSNRLRLLSLPNQQTPLPQNLTVLFALDLWEHAYYLDYQNRRPEYIDAIFSIIDWAAVSARFDDYKSRAL